MATLKARFSLIDEMSDKLIRVAEYGQNMISQWENANSAINMAMNSAASGASNVITALNGVSCAMNSINSSSGSAVSGANAFSNSINKLNNTSVSMKTGVSELSDALSDSVHQTEKYSKTINNAADNISNINSSADSAIPALNNIDNSMNNAAANTNKLSDSVSELENSINETTPKADQWNDVVQKCGQAAGQLDSEMKNVVNVNDELTNVMTQTTNAMSEYTNSGKLSSDMQKQLESTGNAAAQAMQELEKAQNDAKAAMENYDNIVNSGTSNINDLETAQNQLSQALKNLTSAEDNAGKAVKDYENALSTEVDIFSQCELAVGQLNHEMENAANINSELTGSFNQANKAMNEYINSEKMSAEAQNKLESASKSAEKALTYLGDAQNNAKKATDYYNNVIQSGTEDARAYELAQGRLKQTLDNLSTAENKAQNAVKEYEDALRGAGDEIEDFGESAKKAADDSEELGKKGGDSISRLEQLLTDVGIIAGLKKIADGFLECSSRAAEFESAIAKVSTIADTSQLSVGDISSDMMALSKRTGQSVTDLSEAGYQAISASVNTADSVKFTDQANMLSVGGFTQQAAAADVLTTAINAYGMAVEDATRVSDMLITTQNLGKTTVDELAQNMGRVIPLASAYNVEMDNLSSAYAILTKNGIATAESTTYIKSMLNELGDTGSDVSKVLLEDTGQSFASLMEHGYSLADVLTIIGDSVNGDATAFNNLWGSQEAGIGALALFNAGAGKFNQTLNEMQDSAGATSKAYNAMTDTTEHAHQRMQNSFANLGIAVGTGLNPVMKDLYNKVADVTDGVSGFLEKYPGVATALAGSVTAVGLVIGAITAYTAAAKIANTVTSTLNITMSAGKFGLIVGGIAVAGAAIGGLAHAFSSAKDDVEDYNGTLEQCQSEIDRTYAEFNSICQQYGGTSEAAHRLIGEIDTLNKQYQKGGGFVSDYAQRLSESQEKLNSFTSDYKSKMDSIDDSWQNGMVAVAQLETLSQKTQITNSDLDMMSKYADYLNNTFNCNIEVDYDTKSLTGFDPNDINSVMEKVAKDNRKQVAFDSISSDDFTSGYIDEVKNLNKIKDEYARVRGEILKVMNDPSASNDTGFSLREADEKFTEMIEKSQTILDGYRGQITDAYNVMEVPDQAAGYREFLDDLANGFESVGESAEAAQEAMTPQEIAATAWSEYQTQIEELCTAYDEAYNSALESFQGQFGLFEEASMESETYLNSTVENAQAALDTQLAYWNEYGSNIEVLKNTSAADLGLTQSNYDALMSYVQSGSEEAAGLAASMVSEIENGHTETVTKLGETVGEVNAKQSEIAQTTADWQTDFSGQMDEMVKKMGTTVDNLVTEMNASEGARTSAINTLSAYAEQIKASGGHAVDNARDIANQVSSALNSASTNISIGVSGSIPGNATGTTNAEDIFIAGENGPELIVGKQGSTVFPTSETNRIISAVSDLDGGDYTSNNSYLMSENSTEFSTFNSSQNTEIINNYSSVQGDGYDDTKVISLLERMDSTFTAMEREIGSTYTGYTAPDTNNMVPMEVIVDLSLLDSIISKSKYGDEINSFSDSVTYGDTQNIDNSRSISAEYGDTVSNFNDTVVEYGDTIRNYKNIENAFDNSRINDTSASYGDTFSRIAENVINYGDSIRSYENSVEYGDTVKAAYYDNFDTFNSDSSLRIQNYDNRIIAEDESGYSRSESSEYSETFSKKEFTININGNGKIPITVDKGMSKEEILELLWDNAKPIFASILSGEIFEEGDSSYDY